MYTRVILYSATIALIIFTFIKLGCLPRKINKEVLKKSQIQQIFPLLNELDKKGKLIKSNNTDLTLNFEELAPILVKFNLITQDYSSKNYENGDIFVILDNNLDNLIKFNGIEFNRRLIIYSQLSDGKIVIYPEN